MKYRNVALPMILVGMLVCAQPADAASELAAAMAAKPDPVSGEELYRTCAACHGEDGGGVPDGSIPAISGQPTAVLMRQLVGFRSEQRSDIRMEHFADRSHLASAQQLADVASWIAALRRTTPAGIGDGAGLAAGSRAFLRSCQGCHGALGRASADGALPALAGQHAGYLERQLRDAAAGRRPNMNATHRAPMRGLSEAEIRGVADYLSRMLPP